MNRTSRFADKTLVVVYGVGIVGTFLIMGALVAFMRHYAGPQPVDKSRVETRYKNLQLLRAESAEALSSYGWQDPAKGFVRVPIARAIELTLQEWKNPGAGRSNLVARAEKAAELPPKPPEKPNPFE
jgi:hypothetical protein